MTSTINFRDIRPFQFVGDDPDQKLYKHGSDQVDIKNSFIPIPSNLDLQKSEHFSEEEKNVVKEIKYRMTHTRYNPHEKSSTGLDRYFNRNIVTSLSELKRGWENAGSKSLELDRYTDPFIYPKIALYELTQEYMKVQKSDFSKFVNNEISLIFLDIVMKYKHMALHAIISDRARDRIFTKFECTSSFINDVENLFFN